MTVYREHDGGESDWDVWEAARDAARIAGIETQTRAVLFTRVSTEDQTTENQLRDLRGRAAAHGYQVVREISLDGVSAFNPSTLATTIQGLQSDARRGEYDVLMIVALDRLSRQGIGHTLTVLQLFHDAGVRVVSLQESWLDIPETFRDLFVSLAAWAAHYESARRSEYTKSGMARAKANGATLGRPDVTSLVDMDFVKRRRYQGASWNRIAREHPRTVTTPRGGTRSPSAGTIQKAYNEATGQHPKLAVGK